MGISLPDNLANFSWERQPGEKQLDFDRFEVYRDAGPSRTIRQVAKKLGLSPSTLPSAENSWVDRASAYDKWVRVQVSAGLRHAADERERIRLQVFNKAVGCAEKAVDVLLEVMEDRSQSANARVKASCKMLDVIGYKTPELPEHAATALDPAIKARMLDRLTPAERVVLADLNKKMMQAVDEHENLQQVKTRYPGLVPGAGREAANKARKEKAKQKKRSAEAARGKGSQ